MKARILLIGLIALPATPAWPWGTTTAPVEITQGDIDNLRSYVAPNAAPVPQRLDGDTNEEAFMKRFDAHRQANPMHQFIVVHALRLLQSDPAFEGSGFPDVRDINRWDGVAIRLQDGVRGPFARSDAGSFSSSADVAPPLQREPSPGPDADYWRNPATGRWEANPEYDGAAHYYNPWLDTGGAPDAAGSRYAALVDRVESRASARDKGRQAAYLAHYVSDVASAKHADAIEIPAKELGRLWTLAHRFRARRTDEYEEWARCDAVSRNDPSPDDGEVVQAANLRFQQLTRAYARRAGDPGLHDAYWKRATLYIDRGAPIRATGVQVSRAVDVFPQSRCSAIATWLHDFGTSTRSPTRQEPEGIAKPMQAFYGYFDPFYFNGPPINAATKLSNFDLGTPLSEHLRWETAPAQRAFLDKHLGSSADELAAELGLAPSARHAENYRPFPTDDDFYSTDRDRRGAGRRRAVARLVKAESARVHGAIGDAADFDHGDEAFHRYLAAAIQSVATVYRATFTALRIDQATWRDSTVRGHARVRVRVRNVASRPATLRRAVVFGVSPSGAWASLGRTSRRPAIAPDGHVDLDVNVAADPRDYQRLEVEVMADFGGHPDSGMQRARVVPARGADVVGLDDALAAAREGARVGQPVDLVIVFDTTGSMGPSINDLRRQTQEVVEAITNRSGDVRLALVNYRDGTDPVVTPFSEPSTRDDGASLRATLAVMDGWSADGGGDAPEDLLAGLNAGIALWVGDRPRRPGVLKLVVYVTDAPGHVPDRAGRTLESIADFAESVDPAHIYPIVVGTHPQALEHAERLAALTGGTRLRPEDADQVAEALIEAVDEALAAHPPPVPATAVTPSRALAGVGAMAAGSLLLLGGVLACVAGVVLGRRRAAASSP